LVILSRFPILDHQQYMNKFVPAPLYQVVTADSPATAPTAVGWERPLLHAKIDLPNVGTLQIINVHLKSKNPTEVKGQQKDQFTWKTAGGWAEGSFLSAMKRVGQALEARQLIDSIFTEDPDALIAICGDFNSTYDEVPVEAIRGDVEDHGNRELVGRVMVPCERTVPESSRFSLYHHGKGEMLDHILVSRRLLTFYTRTEIHNELLHDESTAFATDDKFPESDHAPVVTEFQVPG
jgi:predicted extracellular nuclease